jgi:SAM-dependent methyltransferase
MIQAVILLIVDGPEDILLADEGEGILSHIFEIIRTCPPIGDVSALCNHQKLFDLAVAAGISASCIEEGGGNSLALPEHYQLWPTSFPIPKDAKNVLVVSPRNPLLTVDALKRAVDLIFQDKTVGAVTSVTASTIHPCQLFTGRLVTRETGEMYFPDQHSFADNDFFPNVPGLWFRNKSGDIINTITGRHVLGRQDYPETVEPDGSFLLLDKKWFNEDAEQPICNFHGVKLTPNESVLLRTRLDFLKYLAKKRAITEKKSLQTENSCLTAVNVSEICGDSKVPEKPSLDHLATGIQQVLRCLLDGKGYRLQNWFPMETVETLLNWWRNMPPHLDRISPFSLVCGDLMDPYGPATASQIIASQADHLPIFKGCTIIDLKSGFGGSARMLARQFGCNVHCVEWDADKVAIANSLNSLEGLDHLITTATEDSGAMQIRQIKDESVALVWGHSWGLEKTYLPLLTESYRVLVPGGTLVNFCRGRFLPFFSQCGFSVFTVHTYFHELLKKAASEFVDCLENLRPFIAYEFGDRTLTNWDLEIERKRTLLTTNYDDFGWVLVEAQK